MEEIAENVFIEASYPRVVLGALRLDHGMVVVDSPFRVEDVTAWQSKLSHLGGGLERLLVLMDPHIDRMMSLRGMETPVIGHENAVDIALSRSGSSKCQELESDTESDHADLPVGGRCPRPNMGYSDKVLIHWGEAPLILSHKPGSHVAGSWLIYNAKKVIFIGDSVVLNQPPFFALADIDSWIEELSQLQSDPFKDYLIVSSRNGVIGMESIERMAAVLTMTKKLINELAQEEDISPAIPELASQLLNKINFDPQHEARYQHRLTWGLEQYINCHFSEIEGEAE